MYINFSITLFITFLLLQLQNRLSVYLLDFLNHFIRKYKHLTKKDLNKNKQKCSKAWEILNLITNDKETSKKNRVKKSIIQTKCWDVCQLIKSNLFTLCWIVFPMLLYYTFWRSAHHLLLSYESYFLFFLCL